MHSPLFLFGIDDLEASTRRQMLRVRTHPWLGGIEGVAGFLHDPASGALDLIDGLPA